MEATVLDLRDKMADILKALERNESVRLTHRGKLKGIIHPPPPTKRKSKEHPFFGMLKGEKKSVEKIMDELRGGRYRDI
jgi:antitoxin (DNA-binding transcriptional repressor) of toxin-antitoxin stability system